jgi:hypothetical protein
LIRENSRKNDTIAKFCRGKHWYTDGTYSVLSEVCPPNWKSGKIARKHTDEEKKHKSKVLKGKNVGKTYYHNGITQIAIPKDSEPPEGYVKGLLPSICAQRKGRTPWNTGKSGEYKLHRKPKI